MQGLLCQRYTNDVLLPLYGPSPATELPINLTPSTSFEKGRILALQSTTANDVQTLTVTGTPTGGTLTIAGTNPLLGPVSFILPFNATSTQAQALAQAAFGSGNVTVTGGALPGTPLVFTFASGLASLPIPVMTIGTNGLTGGTAPAGAIVHTTTGSTAGTFAKYDSTLVTPPATGPTVVGNGAGSSFAAGTYAVCYTFVNAQGETTPSPATLVTITAAQNLRVSAIASIATGVTAVRYYVNGQLAASTVPSAGTAAQTDIATLFATYALTPRVNTAYSIPNGAGTQNAVCVLPFACQTDAAGLVTLSSTTSQAGGFYGEQERTVPAFFAGFFDTSQLVGYDTKALADLGYDRGATVSGRLLAIAGP